MNKKAQFYIMTAIILSGMIVFFSGGIRNIDPPNKEIKMVYENYITESPKVINSAVFNEEDLNEGFTDFNEEFIEYAGSKGIDFYLISIITYNSRTLCSNQFDSEINIVTELFNTTLEKDDQIDIERSNWIKIEIDGQDYVFDTSKKEIQIRSIVKITKEDDIQVYVYD